MNARCILVSLVGVGIVIIAAGANAQAPQPQPNPRVLIETSEGDITVELLRSDARVSVSNFLAYVRDGYYNGTVFHRVIQQFMIQGGGFTASLSQKTTRAPIKNEADNGMSNERGTIAMARTNVVDSATAQFFINHGENNAGSLDHQGQANFGYAVFGRVTEGLDVVDKIAGVETTRQGGHQTVPVEPVIINSVTLQ